VDRAGVSPPTAVRHVRYVAGRQGRPGPLTLDRAEPRVLGRGHSREPVGGAFERLRARLHLRRGVGARPLGPARMFAAPGHPPTPAGAIVKSD
jgi:hypothetical protein